MFLLCLSVTEIQISLHLRNAPHLFGSCEDKNINECETIEPFNAVNMCICRNDLVKGLADKFFV